MIKAEIEGMQQVDRKDLVNKHKKKNEDKLTLVKTYPTLPCIYELFRKAHHHVLQSVRVAAVFAAPPRLAF